MAGGNTGGMCEYRLKGSEYRWEVQIVFTEQGDVDTADIIFLQIWV